MKRKIAAYISIILLLSGICGSEAMAAGVQAGDGRCGMTQAQIIEAADHWYDIDAERHVYIDYNDIEYTGIDMDRFNSIFDQFEADIACSDNEAAVISDYNQLLDFYMELSTQYVISDINYNRDVTNEEYSETLKKIEAQGVDVADKVNSLLRDALRSEYKDTISARLDNDDAVEKLLDYEELTPRQKELESLIKDLQMDYFSVMQKEEHEYNGVSYSISEAEELYDADKISYEEYLEVYYGFCKGVNAETADIYISLVKLLNEKAELKGYNNYAECGYDNYNRDYTIEDVKPLYSDVQNYIVPLYSEIVSKLVYNEKLYEMNLDEEEKLDRVEKIITSIDPGMVMAWDYLRGCHMYDLNQRDTKSDTGFTVDLATYGGAYIFDSPYGTYEDIYTMVHEFGHYNSFFHSVGNTLVENQSLDVAEINSQGLELLSLYYADELFGEENAYDAQLYKLASILDSIISGCIYDEFQVAVFEYEGELTTERLNTLFHDIAIKYGREYEEGQTQDYGWQDIPHTFNQPMYYLSYATSALASADIFAMSVDNRQSAIDLYMNITAYPISTPLRTISEETGLPDIFEPGTIEDISIAVEHYLDKMDAKHALDESAPIIIIVVAVVLVVLAIILLVVLLIRYRKRRVADTTDE